MEKVNQTSDKRGGGASLKKIRLNKHFIIAFVITLLVVCGLWRAVAAKMTWRAVFLTNNQVYFGRFVDMPFADSVTLRDIYYIQLTGPLQPQAAGSDQPRIQVIKLGNEIHGPRDKMVIPKRQIMFWEDLRSDGAMVQAIEEYVKNN